MAKYDIADLDLTAQGQTAREPINLGSPSVPDMDVAGINPGVPGLSILNTMEFKTISDGMTASPITSAWDLPTPDGQH